MKIEKQVERWLAHRLISVDQASRIVEFETTASGASWIFFGAIVVALVSFVTGIISVIAANWYVFGATFKLAAYFAVQTTLGIGFVMVRNASGPARETLLALFAFFFFAGMGLVGQIFNLQSEAYSALFFWCLLTLPAALGSANGIFSTLWHFALVLAVGIWVLKGHGDQSIARFVSASGIACAVYATGIFRIGGRGTPDAFRHASAFWGFVALSCISLAAHSFWYPHTLQQPVAAESFLFLFVGVLMAGLSFCCSTPRYSLPVRFAGLLGLIFLSAAIAGPLALGMQGRVAGALIFALMWSCVAAAAAFSDRRRLFELATSAIALRIVVMYFEVFDSLSTTGIGLILSGVVILAVAIVWHRCSSAMSRSMRSRP